MDFLKNIRYYIILYYIILSSDYTQLDGFTYRYLTLIILFNINPLFAHMVLSIVI